MRNTSIEEIWSKIPKFPSNIEVSNLGNVRKESFDNEYIMLKVTKSGGYLFVSFEGKQFAIHRLVALAFVYNPDPETYKLVNHIDGNKENPCADNLEWVSASENIQHKHKHGLTSNPLIKCIETGEIFSTCVSAECYFGFPRDTIAASARDGEACFGKHFEFIKSEDVDDLEKIYYISGKHVRELSKKMNDVAELREYLKSSNQEYLDFNRGR